jgi:uncharacterized membrane-anchored protein
VTGRTVRRVATVTGVALVQLALVALVVAPRLSARLGGSEYLLRVAAHDPVDPLRGAYVALDYPDLRLPGGDAGTGRRRPDPGDVYVPLLRDGTVWRGGAWSRTRPRDAPYLACTSDGWRLSCGIDSWFTGQDEARVVGARLARAGGTATVRVDGRGHAVLVALDAG